jgi:epoxyqueuosine reductase
MDQGLIQSVLHAMRDAGFGAAGTTPAVLDESDGLAYGRWLAGGLNGGLGYMASSRALRTSPAGLDPWVRGLFCGAMAYNTSREMSAAHIHKGRAWVSRYGWGRDYHKVLRARLRPAAALLEASGHRARICVDTAPLLERPFARQAGIGFIGKNTMLIHPELGSYLFLGEILTDLEVPPSGRIGDGCGDCELCLRACPTAAFAGPRVLDAGLCISTWTIEHRGPFPPSAPPLNGHLFGCDRCQEVCPFNRKAPMAKEREFEARPPWFAPAAREIAGLTPEEWDVVTRGSAIRRARYEGLQRNADRIEEESASARRREGTAV